MLKRADYALGGSKAEDLTSISRLLGVLLLSGVALVVVAMLLGQPQGPNVTGLQAVGGIGALLGAASICLSKHARAWTVHLVFASGTGLIALGMYFVGVPTGAYAVMFVWLVVIAANFFSPRAILTHLVWIMVASGVAMGAVAESSEPSAFPRWAVGSLLLIVAATMIARIVAGRRLVEQQLLAEIEERERLQRELEHMAHHDSLTGLANRRRLDQELTRELARADRADAPLSVIALDLDELKDYNDAHGHAAGDHLLEQAATAWTSGLRAGDLIARVGGDEFVAVLPDCPPELAERLTQRLRHSMPPECTFSAGFACWDGQEPADRLLARADRAMYEAKTGVRHSRQAAGGFRGPRIVRS